MAEWKERQERKKRKELNYQELSSIYSYVQHKEEGKEGERERGREIEWTREDSGAEKMAEADENEDGKT